MNQKVFVYGTLLSGQRNNRLLQNSESKFLGYAEVAHMKMYDLGAFPAAYESHLPESRIVGEVWEVSESVFQRLDRLEGYPHFYDRIQVSTPLGDAWIYINEDAITSPEIPGGDWKEYCRESDSL